ncbi:DUF2388 domain-containing protein [Pseudomonas sp. BRG-100]|uniref:DUF2388 domain-containing protein n=1 Tax=Pseudomonas sp. BRG-100 TaxID=1524267 RepID=UPI0015A63FAD|nr:DUF2388 domain-containing protein [Pseudomonas sp. BRG-100]
MDEKGFNFIIDDVLVRIMLKKFMLSLCLVTIPTSVIAMNDFWIETISSGTTFSTTYLTSKDRKILTATETDASCFVASDGVIRGPYIEAAIKNFRLANPGVSVEDLDLAQSILVNIYSRN